MKHGIFLSQYKYCTNLLKKFEIEISKKLTPMSTNCCLVFDEKGKIVDTINFKGLIGSLFYMTTSRPDIMFSVCMCSRYQSNTNE